MKNTEYNQDLELNSPRSSSSDCTAGPGLSSFAVGPGEPASERPGINMTRTYQVLERRDVGEVPNEFDHFYEHL